MLKRCTRCRRTQPVTQFYPDRIRPDGLRSWCQECDVQAAAKYYRRNKAAVLQRMRTRRARQREESEQ